MVARNVAVLTDAPKVERQQVTLLDVSGSAHADMDSGRRSGQQRRLRCNARNEADLYSVWKNQQVIYMLAAEIEDAAQVTNRGPVAWHIETTA